MTTPISHSAIAHDGLAARFVAGTLSGEASERFDAHLLECPQCQAEVVLAMRIRALGRGALDASPAGRAPRFRRWVLPLGTIAAAAALFMWMPGAGERAALRALGAVPTAPSYLGIAVRTEGDAARPAFDSAFEAAMTAYQRESWRDATAALVALATHPDIGDAEASVHFFAGASALMLGDAALADREFSALLALEESPYHAEGRFYRAKALLRLGRDGDATRDLRAIHDAGLAPRAAALADSIEGLRTR